MTRILIADDGRRPPHEVHISALRRTVDAPLGAASVEARRGHGHRIRS
ncbi:hypothetical protein [Tsukamurella pseudospumae]|nr:hypothetical protein [Tsukamurella pseudospumae]